MQLGNNSLAQVALGAISPFATDDLLEFTAAEFELAPSVMPLGPFVPWLTRQWEFDAPIAGLSAPIGWTVAALEIEPSASPLWVQVPWVATGLELDTVAPNMLILLGGATTQFWLTPWLVQAEEADTAVVVFNANTLAVSEYSIAALDVVEHEGELYFVTAPELVTLAADAQEAFSWSFSTGELGLVEGAFGAVTKLAFHGRSDGEIRLTVTATEYGEATEVFYSLPCESTGQSRGQHVLLARDVHAEEWAFKFEGTTAAEIENIAVLLGTNKRSW